MMMPVCLISFRKHFKHPAIATELFLITAHQSPLNMQKFLLVQCITLQLQCLL